MKAFASRLQAVNDFRNLPNGILVVKIAEACREGKTKKKTKKRTAA
jgi:hypothetical protein